MWAWATAAPPANRMTEAEYEEWPVASSVILLMGYRSLAKWDSWPGGVSAPTGPLSGCAGRGSSRLVILVCAPSLHDLAS